MSHSLINQSYLVANVDRLVRDVLSNSLSFEEVKNRLNVLYQPFMIQFNFDLFYSQSINAFVYSTNAIVGDSYPSDVIWDHEKTQQFIQTLSYYKNDIDFEYNAWHYQESQNKKNLEVYLRNLTSHYARLLFVRVDLKYSEETSHLVTIEDFYDHMEKFRELISNKKTCFEHLQGHVWALEQGKENAGLHSHLLLIYDGAQRQRDFHIAKAVGEKWVNITDGLGYCFKCNTSDYKEQYERYGRLGIGMIHRNNPKQVENAIRTALYLAKPDKDSQQLKVWLPNMRTFGHGIYRTNKRRGLPPITN